ncbi:MAG: L,D-transpeptidase [Aestuariivirga sp.]
MDDPMPVSRRKFLSSALATGFLLNETTVARSAEPFRVNMNESEDVVYKWRRRDMAYQSNQPPGTIVVESRNCFLYHLQGGGMATRYGVSVGKSTMAWSGEATIKKMTPWPIWVPAPYHLEHMPSLAKWIHGMPGGLDNPLGARAMYLYQGEVDTINRIHGAAKPEDIGSRHTAGCIGMLNVDVIHLYANVQIGTRVVMI